MPGGQRSPNPHRVSCSSPSSLAFQTPLCSHQTAPQAAIGKLNIPKTAPAADREEFWQHQQPGTCPATPGRAGMLESCGRSGAEPSVPPGWNEAFHAPAAQVRARSASLTHRCRTGICIIPIMFPKRGTGSDNNSAVPGTIREDGKSLSRTRWPRKRLPLAPSQRRDCGVGKDAAIPALPSKPMDINVLEKERASPRHCSASLSSCPFVLHPLPPQGPSQLYHSFCLSQFSPLAGGKEKQECCECRWCVEPSLPTRRAQQEI